MFRAAIRVRAPASACSAEPVGHLERVENELRAHLGGAPRGVSRRSSGCVVVIKDKGEYSNPRPGADVVVGVGPRRATKLSRRSFPRPALRTGGPGLRASKAVLRLRIQPTTREKIKERSQVLEFATTPHGGTVHPRSGIGLSRHTAGPHASMSFTAGERPHLSMIASSDRLDAA